MKDSDYSVSHESDHVPPLELCSLVRGTFVVEEHAASFFTVAAE